MLLRAHAFPLKYNTVVVTIASQLDSIMTNTLPIRDVEAQLPAAERSRSPATISPDRSPRLLGSDYRRRDRRDSSASTILPLAGVSESRRPSVIKETSPLSAPATPPAEHDAKSTTSAKHPWWHPITKPVVQMLVAAALAVIIGIVVAATVENVPDAARALLAIPGDLWLRALKCIGKSNSDSYVLVELITSGKRC